MAKLIIGTVLKKSGAQTVAVSVDTMKIHPRYHKRYTRRTVYHVHDANDTAQVGSSVTIKEVKPISKTKKWIIVETKEGKE